MIISYNWLQEYFDEKLPEPEKLAEVLTMGAFEVEQVKKIDGIDGYMLDIDVLPNRTHDCLSHRGIARETATLLDRNFKEREKKVEYPFEEVPHLHVIIEEPELCRRYIGRVIENIKVGESPKRIREYLKVIGQKSINSIVDATNFVMFDTGQPLHAFDMDKVEGSIVVRKAKKGEKITTLDNKEVELDEETLVIADEKDPLAIAGIKGGKKAEVDEETKNIILEAASFHPSHIRKTAQRIGIKTDSSKRFENETAIDLADEAIEELADIIFNNTGSNDTKVHKTVDMYIRRPAQYKVGVSAGEVNGLLGADISQEEIQKILDRLHFETEIVKDVRGKVASCAKKYIGTPYKYGASITYDAPREFDCSSFTSFLYAQAGVSIPRMTVDQFVYGYDVEEKDLEPGDIVFANTGIGKDYDTSIEFMKGTKTEKRMDHCGVYTGDGKVTHASRHNSDGIITEDIKESEQFKNLIGYKRMIKKNGPRFVVSAPRDRLDIRIKEDLIEEIGRVYGYKNVVVQLADSSDKKPKINKQFYYANKIRKFLAWEGFSETYGYSLTDRGDVEIANPLAADKGLLRTNLRDDIKESLELNANNAPLLGLNEIRMFEFGKVFGGDDEHVSLCIGVNGKGANVAPVLEKLSDILGVSIADDSKDNIFETNFEKLIEKLPCPDSYDGVFCEGDDTVRYNKISQYPFMLRDIAVWTPAGISKDEVLEIIRKEVGELLVRTTLFDEFSKDDRVSYAYHLVFLSNEKTLTDDEVNKIMGSITEKMNDKKDWEVR